LPLLLLMLNAFKAAPPTTNVVIDLLGLLVLVLDVVVVVDVAVVVAVVVVSTAAIKSARISVDRQEEINI